MATKPVERECKDYERCLEYRTDGALDGWSRVEEQVLHVSAEEPQIL